MSTESKTEGFTFYPSPNLKANNVHDLDIGLTNIGLIISQAYNEHKNLRFTPDDVWVSILSAFSKYVNLNSEVIRNLLVDFPDKKDLWITIDPHEEEDHEMQVERFNNLVKCNIKDPELVNVLIPQFSTTTDQSKFAFSIISMSTFNKYFDYKCMIRCGIPKVTMLGTVDDYKKILNGIKFLQKFDNPDNHLEKWFKHLIPVIWNFISSISGAPDLGWWNSCCTKKERMSGTPRISGWVTAFNPYSRKDIFLLNEDSIELEEPDFMTHSGETDIHYYSPGPIYLYSVTLTGMLISVDQNGDLAASVKTIKGPRYQNQRMLDQQNANKKQE